MGVQQRLLVIAAKVVVKACSFRLENVDAIFTKKMLLPPSRHKGSCHLSNYATLRWTYPTCSDIHKTVSISVSFSYKLKCEELSITAEHQHTSVSICLSVCHLAFRTSIHISVLTRGIFLYNMCVSVCVYVCIYIYIYIYIYTHTHTNLYRTSTIDLKTYKPDWLDHDTSLRYKELI